MPGPQSENCAHCCCERRSTASRLFGRAHSVTDLTKQEDFTDASTAHGTLQQTRGAGRRVLLQFPVC
eukprot:4436898-Alexandrium_andersonii.AAC.1